MLTLNSTKKYTREICQKQKEKRSTQVEHHLFSLVSFSHRYKLIAQMNERKVRAPLEPRNVEGENVTTEINR